MTDATFLLRHLDWLGYSVNACIDADGLVMSATKDGETWIVKSSDPHEDYEAAVQLCENAGVDLEDG